MRPVASPHKHHARIVSKSQLNSRDAPCFSRSAAILVAVGRSMTVIASCASAFFWAM